VKERVVITKKSALERVVTSLELLGSLTHDSVPEHIVDALDKMSRDDLCRFGEWLDQVRWNLGQQRMNGPEKGKKK
jgi:hypothetical protein